MNWLSEPVPMATAGMYANWPMEAGMLKDGGDGKATVGNATDGKPTDGKPEDGKAGACVDANGANGYGFGGIARGRDWF